jgi:predicted glutamine amidotransferase
MCQLLGMNCATPTDITFSFKGFTQRAGVTSDHSDGWGIAFFEDKACRLFVDIQSAVDSPIAHFIRNNPIKSKNVLAHIRKATQGKIEMENSHPFMRELWGRHWIFAHNGNLENYAPTLDGSFMPVGTTDSERAYCAILQTLRKRFGNVEPSIEQLFDALAEIAPQIAAHGTFNFILSNGQALFAYATTHLSWLIRAWPFSQAHLVDMDVDIDFSHYTTPEDRVAIIATQPLTDNEQWTTFKCGELLGFVNGHLRHQVQTQVTLLSSIDQKTA